jgi:hypothetical protein
MLFICYAALLEQQAMNKKKTVRACSSVMEATEVIIRSASGCYQSKYSPCCSLVLSAGLKTGILSVNIVRVMMTKYVIQFWYSKLPNVVLE